MSYSEFMEKMLGAFPNAQSSMDQDGQLIIHTNLTVLSSEDNPSIPAGELLVVDMDTRE